MKFKKHIVLLICAFITIVSCNKKSLPSEPNAPVVFYLKGDIDNQPVVLEAGNSNYYLNTSFFWDTNQVCRFKSDLYDRSCAGSCKGYAATIILNDSKISLSNSRVNLDAVLKTGMYLFNEKDLPSTHYLMDLAPEISNSPNETFDWTIENHLSTTITSKEYCPAIVLNANQVYNVALNFHNGNSCNAIHLNTYKIGAPVQTTIAAIRNLGAPGATYDFSCQTTGKAPFQYLWNFGNGISSNLPNPSHAYQIILNGRSTVTLQVVDANNDTCKSYYQVQTSGDPSCDANFKASFKALPDTKAFSTITIMITDPSGRVYSSKNVNQPNTSFFEITEVNDYIKNAENLPTKRMLANLNCVLSDGVNQIKLTNTQVSMAFAYSN